jgi:hypothetical protein
MKQAAVIFNFKEYAMWKIFLGFVIFAGLGLFMIFKGGDKVDMSGEKHDTGSHTAAPAAPAATPAATPAAAPAPSPAAATSSAK